MLKIQINLTVRAYPNVKQFLNSSLYNTYIKPVLKLGIGEMKIWKEDGK